MGWLTGWSSKGELVEHITREWREPLKAGGDTVTTCLARCWRGNPGNGVLWTVFESAFPDGRPSERFIVAFLMKCWDRGGDWGFKDVTESMGPYEVNCPLGYLDMVPEAPNEWGRQWRERVRAYHARQSRRLEVGRTYALLNCKGITRATIVGLRPLVGDADDGGRYRLRKALVGHEIK